MKKFRLFLFCLLISLISYNSLFAAISTAPDKDRCVKQRYIFDIGSGATKLQVKKVNICNNEIISEVHDAILHINFQNCIDNAKNKNHLPEDCMRHGVNSIKNLLDELEVDCIVNSCYAITTQWSRNIDNADQFIKSMKELGIQTKRISQDEEGFLAYKSLVYSITKPTSNYAAWDIGAGSAQITFNSSKNDITIFDFPHGINSFSNHFHNDIIKKEPGTLNMEESLIAVNYLKDNIVNNKHYKDLKTIHPSNIFSIGRIFNFALVKELNYPNKITKDRLYQDIEFFATHSLDEVTEKYPDLPKKFAKHTQLTLIFVYSFMDQLEWDEVDVKKVSLTDYLLLAGEEYWYQTA